MTRHWFRYFVAAVSALGLALGVLAIATEFRGSAAAQAGATHTIEILDSGFNPAHCQVNRNGDKVKWLNKSSVTRRVRIPIGSSGGPLVYFDTGDLEPGETSTAPLQVQSVARISYKDYYDESLEGLIVAPFDPNAAAQCSPLPPTPTPSPTPSVTPSPSPTPPPTPQKPPWCQGNLPASGLPIQGCAVAPDLTRNQDAVG